VVTFTSPDPLGLTFVTYAAVGVTSGSVSVMVKRDNVTVAASADPHIVTASRPEYRTFDVGRPCDVVPRVSEQPERTDVPDLRPAEGIVPTLFSTVPFLVFLYGAIQIGWWVVLRRSVSARR